MTTNVVIEKKSKGISSPNWTRTTAYLDLIKYKQTALLVYTGAMGYIASQRFKWLEFLLFVIATTLIVSGTTIFNMVYERDIDAKMSRTKRRPIPSGFISPREALIAGTALLGVGLLIATRINLLTAGILFTGFFLYVFIYTLLLKRRTKFSVVPGGIGGAMPALAGRTAAIGSLDVVGVLFLVFVSTWVPLHFLTIAILYREDYEKAGIPMWPVVNGILPTVRIIALSSVGTAAVGTLLGIALSIHWGFLIALLLPSAYIMVLALKNLIRPTNERNWTLFKLASVYMLYAYIVFVIGSFFKTDYTPILSPILGYF